MGLKLTDFFQPLNLITLSYFFGLFIFFDILGTFLKKKVLRLESNPSTRILNWLLGFGIFIFLWFLLSLIITPDKYQLLISIGILLCITLPSYIKEKEGFKFLELLWLFKVPILIIIPFLPAIFVKASLPPYYWDEMAYHFIAPNALATLAPIKYTGGLYGDVPRILDFFWQIIFTLFHTYSVARLFHFTILATSMIYAYAILKKNFGLLTGFLFVFVFFGLPQDIVLTSTLGYVDVGAYSFLLIAVISAIDFLVNLDKAALFSIFIFWSMNLGTKYTGVSSFVSFLILFLAIIIWKRKILKKFISWKFIIFLVGLFLVFGGYWYVKNFVLFGNPIYPFIFPCLWGHYSTTCPQTSGFFGDWTLKITLTNAYSILSQLFPKYTTLQGLVLLTPIISFWGSNKKIRLLSYFAFGTVALELLILKYFSGFYIRYHQHMQLYLLLGVILMLVNKYRNKYLKILVRFCTLVFVITAVALYIHSIRYDSWRLLNWSEVNYAIGKTNINQWVNYNFPKMKDTISWCENTPNNEMTPLARLDPDLIWFSYEGLMRVFMVDCNYFSSSLQGIPPGNVIEVAKDQKMEFWISSLNGCLSDKELSAMKNQYSLRELNNKIICNSKEIKPHLYYFDYKNLK